MREKEHSDAQKSQTSGCPDPQWVGDGKRKETAIFFTNARGLLEHIRMQHQFIRANGIHVTGLRYSTEPDERYIYDVWPTADGDLWFKVPLSEPDEFLQEVEQILKKRQSSFLEFEARLQKLFREESDQHEKS